jgi:hypothetical protein
MALCNSREEANGKNKGKNKSKNKSRSQAKAGKQDERSHGADRAPPIVHQARVA